jgi:hypothetical protein
LLKAEPIIKEHKLRTRTEKQNGIPKNCDFDERTIPGKNGDQLPEEIQDGVFNALLKP